MKFEFKDKVALITGAGNGLGRCLSNHFARLGVRIAAVDISRDSLKVLEEEVKSGGGSILCYPLDVSDYDGIKKVVDLVEAKWGTIDILINNAGVYHEKPFETLSQEDIDIIIDTNLKGTIYCTRHVAGVMMKQKSGNIINISSTSGLRGFHGNGIYSASKYGVNGFSDSMSKYLMKYKIRTTTLCPGAMQTTLWDREEYPAEFGGVESIMHPSEIAELIEFILKGSPNTIFNRMTLYPVCESEEL